MIFTGAALAVGCSATRPGPIDTLDAPDCELGWKNCGYCGTGAPTVASTDGGAWAAATADRSMSSALALTGTGSMVLAGRSVLERLDARPHGGSQELLCRLV